MCPFFNSMAYWASCSKLMKHRPSLLVRLVYILIHLLREGELSTMSPHASRLPCHTTARHVAVDNVHTRKSSCWFNDHSDHRGTSSLLPFKTISRDVQHPHRSVVISGRISPTIVRLVLVLVFYPLASKMSDRMGTLSQGFRGPK